MIVITPLIRLFLIYLILSIILFLISRFFNAGIPFDQSAVILTGSFFISVIVFVIFKRGYDKGGKSWLIYTLAAITVKFLLYLFLIVTVFFFSKNRTLEFILTFFVIYLAFTLYLLFSFVKQLKTKNLEK
jgi:hypothetical protein